MATFYDFKFRIVFWDVLPCKITVERRFRNFVLAAVRTSNLTFYDLVTTY
jgi:hypothetical protein